MVSPGKWGRWSTDFPGRCQALIDRWHIPRHRRRCSESNPGRAVLLCFALRTAPHHCTSAAPGGYPSRALRQISLSLSSKSFYVWKVAFVYCCFTAAICMYGKTSLNRPPAGVKSCGPFREVVDLQDFSKFREYTVLLILVLWKAGRCREGVDL